MTIDEAIARAREVANEQKRRSGECVTNDKECDKFSTCIKCAEEHEQLAEWLEELKELRLQNHLGRDEALIAGRKEGYNKAIDDFAKEICKMIVQSEKNGNYRFYAVEIKQAIVDLAEQLKAGGKE